MRAFARTLRGIGFAAPLVCAHAHVAGQPAPALGDPTGRAGEPPPFLQELPRPAPTPVPILPPPPPLPERADEPAGAAVFLREVRVEGSTVLSDREVADAARPYLNRRATQDDLEALRVALTQMYVDRGYVNSGAILPDQELRDGVVTYRIVEGRIADIEVRGNRWFRGSYLASRLALSGGPPLDMNALQERFRLLLDDPRIERLNAELQPGVRAGEARLRVQVEERPPYRFAAEVDNYQSPSVGAERTLLLAEHQNLTGNGDVARLEYGRSSGLDPMLDLRYALPITRHDTLLALRYRKNTFSLIEAPFEPLDIRSESDVYGVSVRHPLSRTLSRETALELAAERLSNRTTLLGEPFTLSAGAQGGKSVVSAVRAAVEGIARTANELVAVRSRFSVGVDALGATTNEGGDVPSGKFFAWLGQFQWVRRLAALDTVLIFRADAQLADDPLLALEQFSIGGRYTVRGYRENTFVRDNAVVASFEARVPIVRNAAWADYVELAPFIDYGRGWNAADAARTPALSSAGIGLRWGATWGSQARLRPQLELYYGHAFRDIATPGGDLQDKGIHFQLSLTAS